MNDMQSNYFYNFILETKILGKYISQGCYNSRILDDTDKKH